MAHQLFYQNWCHRGTENEEWIIKREKQEQISNIHYMNDNRRVRGSNRGTGYYHVIVLECTASLEKSGNRVRKVFSSSMWVFSTPALKPNISTGESLEDLKK